MKKCNENRSPSSLFVSLRTFSLNVDFTSLDRISLLFANTRANKAQEKSITQKINELETLGFISRSIVPIFGVLFTLNGIWFTSKGFFSFNALNVLSAETGVIFVVSFRLSTGVLAGAKPELSAIVGFGLLFILLFTSNGF